jgi:hypothetical protein
MESHGASVGENISDKENLEAMSVKVRIIPCNIMSIIKKGLEQVEEI